MVIWPVLVSFMVMFVQVPEMPAPQLPADHDNVMVFSVMVPAFCAFWR